MVGIIPYWLTSYRCLLRMIPRISSAILFRGDLRCLGVCGVLHEGNPAVIFIIRPGHEFMLRTKVRDDAIANYDVPVLVVPVPRIIAHVVVMIVPGTIDSPVDQNNKR